MLTRIASWYACFCVCVTLATRISSTSTCNVTGLQANCTAEHLTAPPVDLPANITTLILDDNQIKALNANAFSSTPNLVKLTITHCGVSGLDDATFTGLKMLTDLRLNQNNLTSISDKVFGPDLGNLVILYLNYNSIFRISRNALDHLVKLQYLYLDHNKLTSIHPHAFTKLAVIKSISIGFNRLKTAKKEWFYPVSKSLKHISMQNNSWVCDCEMTGYKNWTNVAHQKFNTDVDIMCSDKHKALKNIHGKDLCQLSAKTLNVTFESTITISCPEATWQSWSFAPRARNKTMHLVTSSDDLKILSTGLTVIGADKSDIGTYCCAADSQSSMNIYANKHCTMLRVVSSPTGKTKSNSSATVVVIVILIATSVVCLAVWFLKRKRRNYGLLNDETVYDPTIDEYEESSHIAPRNPMSSTTEEAYV